MVPSRKLKLLAGVAALALPLGAAPAFAGPAPCVAADQSNGCQYLVTFNADGSVSLTDQTAKNGTSYDGSDDVQIGVINNASTSLTGFNLTGSGVGDFESGDGSDGIDAYAKVVNTKDPTGYGGPDAYFANNTGNSLDVRFVTALTAGQSTYFSLEAPPSFGISARNNPPVSAVPEPASMTLVATGLLGLFTIRRRRA